MNNINIIGRLTADPKCETTPNGYAVVKFNVAVTRPHTKDTTDFIRCVAWRNTAEFIEKYFCKGKMIAIIGILTSRSWKDDNNKGHSVMEVLVENVEFCGDKSTAAKQAEPPQEPAAASDIPEGFKEYDEDEDIPF